LKVSSLLGYVPESRREGRALWRFKGFLMTIYIERKKGKYIDILLGGNYAYPPHPLSAAESLLRS